MIRPTKKLAGADLFCGAGGFTCGAVASGFVDVRLAINHWRPAVFSHQENHPNTRHICARIDDVDPRNDRTLPKLDVLLASPECTHHSNARGGRPIDDQKRATPWHVCVWAEAKRPKWIAVENVREFRDWGPLDATGRPIKSRKGEIFRAWIASLQSLGYQVDHQLLNAADFGAATSRTRLFIVARRGRSKRDIPWPDPTHSKAQWRPAYEIIDWQKPCPSIFHRKRLLADKTLKRIEIGLRKFVEPFIVQLRRNQTAHGCDEPLRTITTSGAHHGLCVPFFMPREGIYDSKANRKRSRGVEEPLPTIIASHGPGHLVTPFLVKYHGGAGRAHAVNEPLRTIDTQNRFGLAMPYMMSVNHGGHDHRSRSASEPLRTVTTSNGHSIVIPFLTKYYGTAGAVGVDRPLDTVTVRDRFGLAMAELVGTMHALGVVDIGFRMLDVDELLAAQGFDRDYYLHGTKAERVKQVGNSVSPPVGEALCRTIGENN